MNGYHPITKIKISIDFGENIKNVGTLAIHNQKIYFEYDREFINDGLEISPLRLPLKPGVQSFDHNLFEGLPGVFNDSLPDGWGRLLLDRFLRSQNILPSEISPLDRLAFVGSDALGALIYEPSKSNDPIQGDINLDILATQAQEVLDGTADSVLENLINLNGSSAGARPKALISLNETKDHIIHGLNKVPEGYTSWIVKFPNNQDGPDVGAIEYVYALMAKDAGIKMPDIHLFTSNQGSGYFAIKRFDKHNSERYHMHTACGLLHSDFRTPSLDYEDLMSLTGYLTKDVRELENLFRLCVFNVLAHNRDDHSKNFSYLMDSTGQWKLSPAYDLTFSSGPNGEQSTMVMGEGRNPNITHLLKLAESVKIDKKHALEIINSTKASLENWERIAKKYNVSPGNIKLIKEKIAQISRI